MAPPIQQPHNHTPPHHHHQQQQNNQLPQHQNNGNTEGGQQNEEPGGSIVLEEEIDPDYEPTQDEIIEYARWLGMDLEADEDLLWIAKEGLKAPLPENWKPCKTSTDNGEIYYFNFESGESTWDHPCDEYYRWLYEEERRKRSGTNGVTQSKEVVQKKKSEHQDVARIVANQLGKLPDDEEQMRIRDLQGQGLSRSSGSLGGLGSGGGGNQNKSQSAGGGRSNSTSSGRGLQSLAPVSERSLGRGLNTKPLPSLNIAGARGGGHGPLPTSSSLADVQLGSQLPNNSSRLPSPPSSNSRGIVSDLSPSRQAQAPSIFPASHSAHKGSESRWNSHGEQGFFNESSSRDNSPRGSTNTVPTESKRQSSDGSGGSGGGGHYQVPVLGRVSPRNEQLSPSNERLSPRGEHMSPRGELTSPSMSQTQQHQHQQRQQMSPSMWSSSREMGSSHGSHAGDGGNAGGGGFSREGGGGMSGLAEEKVMSPTRENTATSVATSHTLRQHEQEQQERREHQERQERHEDKMNKLEEDHAAQVAQLQRQLDERMSHARSEMDDARRHADRELADEVARLDNDKINALATHRRDTEGALESDMQAIDQRINRERELGRGMLEEEMQSRKEIEHRRSGLDFQLQELERQEKELEVKRTEGVQNEQKRQEMEHRAMVDEMVQIEKRRSDEAIEHMRKEREELKQVLENEIEGLKTQVQQGRELSDGAHERARESAQEYAQKQVQHAQSRVALVEAELARQTKAMEEQKRVHESKLASAYAQAEANADANERSSAQMVKSTSDAGINTDDVETTPVQMACVGVQVDQEEKVEHAVVEQSLRAELGFVRSQLNDADEATRKAADMAAARERELVIQAQTLKRLENSVSRLRLEVESTNKQSHKAKQELAESRENEATLNIQLRAQQQVAAQTRQVCEKLREQLTQTQSNIADAASRIGDVGNKRSRRRPRSINNSAGGGDGSDDNDGDSESDNGSSGVSSRWDEFTDAQGGDEDEEERNGNRHEDSDGRENAHTINDDDDDDVRSETADLSIAKQAQKQAEERCELFQQQVDEMRTQLTEAELAVARVSRESEQTLSEMDSLQAQLRDAHEQIDAAQEMYHAAIKRVEETQTQTREVQRALESAEAELERMNANAEEAQAEAETTAETVVANKRAYSEVVVAGVEVAELKSAKLNLERQVEEAIASAEEARKDKIELEAACNELQQESAKLSNQVRVVSAQLQDAWTNAAEAEARTVAGETAAAAAAQQAQDISLSNSAGVGADAETICALQASKNELTEIVAEQRAESEELTRISVELRAQNKLAVEQARRAEESRDGLQTQLQQVNLDAIEFEFQVRAGKQQSERLDLRVRMLEDEIAQLRQAAEASGVEHSAAVAKSRQAEAALVRAERERQDAVEKLTVTKQELAKLKEELRTNLDEYERNGTVERQRLINDVASENAKLRELESRYREIEEESTRRLKQQQQQQLHAQSKSAAASEEQRPEQLAVELENANDSRMRASADHNSTAEVLVSLFGEPNSTDANDTESVYSMLLYPVSGTEEENIEVEGGRGVENIARATWIKRVNSYMRHCTAEAQVLTEHESELDQARTDLRLNRSFLEGFQQQLSALAKKTTTRNRILHQENKPELANEVEEASVGPQVIGETKETLRRAAGVLNGQVRAYRTRKARVRARRDIVTEISKLCNEMLQIAQFSISTAAILAPAAESSPTSPLSRSSASTSSVSEGSKSAPNIDQQQQQNRTSGGEHVLQQQQSRLRALDLRVCELFAKLTHANTNTSANKLPAAGRRDDMRRKIGVDSGEVSPSLPLGVSLHDDQFRQRRDVDEWTDATAGTSPRWQWPVQPATASPPRSRSTRRGRVMHQSPNQYKNSSNAHHPHQYTRMHEHTNPSRACAFDRNDGAERQTRRQNSTSTRTSRGRANGEVARVSSTNRNHRDSREEEDQDYNYRVGSHKHANGGRRKRVHAQQMSRGRSGMLQRDDRSENVKGNGNIMKRNKSQQQQHQTNKKVSAFSPSASSSSSTSPSSSGSSMTPTTNNNSAAEFSTDRRRPRTHQHQHRRATSHENRRRTRSSKGRGRHRGGIDGDGRSRGDNKYAQQFARVVWGAPPPQNTYQSTRHPQPQTHTSSFAQHVPVHLQSDQQYEAMWARPGHEPHMMMMAPTNSSSSADVNSNGVGGVPQTDAVRVQFPSDYVFASTRGVSDIFRHLTLERQEAMGLANDHNKWLTDFRDQIRTYCRHKSSPSASGAQGALMNNNFRRANGVGASVRNVCNGLTETAETLRALEEHFDAEETRVEYGNEGVSDPSVYLEGKTRGKDKNNGSSASQQTLEEIGG